ncbi:pirin-related protein [Zymobacter palmae]|uniref:Pirin-related protein n=1 Tax=Zymobacter palmae TaxID=33074 RepID=A0A348HEQ3_9GAMM|nr:pirin-related protein [Zymobacter palmae]
MLKVRKAEERGVSRHDGLISWHTFSFGEYADPRHPGYSDLLVINDDRVAGGHGFGAHPHRDMEILTYVLEGALAHRDGMGSHSILYPGEIQLMSAGTGVTHSEMNASADDEVHFLQIWIVPREHDLAPRYQQRVIAPSEKNGRLALILSEDGRDDSLMIAQDVSIYIGMFGPGQKASLPLAEGRCIWLHVATGQISVNGQLVHAGDGVCIEHESHLVLKDGQDAKVIVFDLRQQPFTAR